MKKIVLTCLGLVALFTSCSDDDTSGTGNSPLVATTQTMYENGEVAELFKSEYDNGKITKIKWLSPNNVQEGYNELSYDNGLLTAISSYYGTTLYSAIDYSYDNQGRMTGAHYTSQSEGMDYTTTFTHNNDNTITTFSDNGWDPAKTYFLNSEGYVYKEVREGYTYELAYDGATPVSATYNNQYTTTFEYDPVHDRSLINMNMGEGNFKPNAVLRLNSLTDNNGSTNNKYLLKTINEGNVVQYVYTFNEEGLPIKMMEYHDDELTNEIEYFY